MQSKLKLRWMLIKLHALIEMLSIENIRDLIVKPLNKLFCSLKIIHEVNTGMLA